MTYRSSRAEAPLPQAPFYVARSGYGRGELANGLPLVASPKASWKNWHIVVFALFLVTV